MPSIALQSYDGRPLTPMYEGQPTNQVMMFVNLFYKYDDASTVRVFDTKILDIQKQIDDLKARVESLEQWRSKSEN